MRYLESVSKPDLIGSGIVIAIGIFVAAWSPQYGLANGAVIGPGFVPFWFGLAIAVFGATTVIGAFMKARRLARSQSAVPEQEVRVDTGQEEIALAGDTEQAEEVSAGAGHRWHRAALVFALVIVAVALTPLLGFAVAFGLVTFTILCLIERERWWVSLITTAGVMGLLYWLFAAFLQIPVPIGPWGF